jgi:hypothetical protein
MRSTNSQRRLISGVSVVAMIVACVLGGCSGPSVWQQSFVRSEDVQAVALAKDEPVRVRSIPWERMSATQRDIEAMSASSDVHPQDWPVSKKLEAKSVLLRGLQVGADPGSTDVIGVCEFRSTDAIRPEGPERTSLESFARSIGATDVVWSSRSLGKADKIIEKPVTTVSSGTYWADHRRSSRDRWWSDNYSENSTTWVPIRVQAEETGFIMYFLRTGSRP